MWDHYCKVERTMMSVEDGKECNWCGRREEDESAEFGRLGPNEFPDDELEDYLREGDEMEQEIEIEEVIDHEDGSATVRMDISERVQRLINKQGLEYLIKEMRMHDKIEVLEANSFTSDAKTWELSDEELNALFHFGFIAAIRAGMGEMQ